MSSFLNVSRLKKEKMSVTGLDISKNSDQGNMFFTENSALDLITNGKNGSENLFLANSSGFNDSGSTSDQGGEGNEHFDEAFKEAQWAILVFYTLLIVIAVIGNSCVVFVVISKRKMRTVTNYFIASLAVSDLMMAFVCVPFSFVPNVLLDYWPFGAALCPIVLYLQAAVVFQNAYTLLAMSLERYIAILHPFLRRLGKRRCLHIVAMCWVLAFLTPIPTAVTARITSYIIYNETMDVCFEHWATESQRFAYSMTIMVLQYFVPLLVLIYTYAMIVHVVWLKDNMPTPGELLNHNEKDTTQEKHKETVADPRKKIIKMMLTVVGIYSTCWLPLHALTIAMDVDNTLYERNPHMRVVWIASHWLAMSSCMYNPFIYWWMNPKFREAFQTLIPRLKSCLCRDHNDRKCMYGNDRRFFSKCDNGQKHLARDRLQAKTATVELVDMSCNIRVNNGTTTTSLKTCGLGHINDLAKTIVNCEMDV